MSTRLLKHYKSPFPACNVHRRNEPIATDTVYSDTPAIDSGCKCAQIFVGTKTMVTDVYGMKTEKKFVNTLQDIIRTRGAPTKLLSDHANVEISNKVKDILRYLMIPDWQSKPYHQHQNPAERRYRTVKETTNCIMDRTGTPAFLWLEALKYTCYLLNHTLCQSIDAIPLQLLNGSTVDISALLQYHWYQRVYCAEDDYSFPSNSKEISGRFVGFSKNVGHSLTYKILTDHTHKIIHCSCVCYAEDPKSINVCADKWGENDVPHEFISTRIDDSPALDDKTNANNSMPIIDIEDLIGKLFPIVDDHGNNDNITIVDILEKHQNQVKQDPKHVQFKVQRNSSEYEDIIAYNELMDIIETNRETKILWEFKRIKGHQGPLSQKHPDYKGSTYNVTIDWENGEITDEPLSIIAIDAPLPCKNMLRIIIY